ETVRMKKQVGIVLLYLKILGMIFVQFSVLHSCLFQIAGSQIEVTEQPISGRVVWEIAFRLNQEIFSLVSLSFLKIQTREGCGGFEISGVLFYALTQLFFRLSKASAYTVVVGQHQS